MKIKMKIKIKSKYFMAKPNLNPVESFEYEYIKLNQKSWKPAFIGRKLVLQP